MATLSTKSAPANFIDAHTLKKWLSDDDELALLDVREAGQYGAGHPLFAVPVPYSRFEERIGRLVPNPGVRMILLDNGDGIAEEVALIARSMGYQRIYCVKDGIKGWQNAGYELFEGVNVPSKVFGELLEHERKTPSIRADELHRRIQAHENLLVLDGRTTSEFHKMNIPGAKCCPNGELALRIDALAPDDSTTVVINCAGRTRSILGAQTLIDAGITNPVYALENGTQGWFLSGYALENGNTAHYPSRDEVEPKTSRRLRAQNLARHAGVQFLDSDQLQEMLDDNSRTTYLLDVRTAEEFCTDSLEGFIHAPGGQLVQATDQWVGVQNSRIVLVDNDGIRASMTAWWMSQLGHSAFVLSDGLSAKGGFERKATQSLAPPAVKLLPVISANQIDPDQDMLLDFRSGTSFRKMHIRQSEWMTRPGLSAASLPADKRIVMIGDNRERLSRYYHHFCKSGFSGDAVFLGFDETGWPSTGLDLIHDATEPHDEQLIDFIFHTHDRHQGNAEAARAYLAWETGLLDRLDGDERNVFRIVHPLKEDRTY